MEANHGADGQRDTAIERFTGQGAIDQAGTDAVVGVDMGRGGDYCSVIMAHREGDKLVVNSISDVFKPVIRMYYSLLETELVLYAEKNTDFLPKPCTSFGEDVHAFHKRQRERSANRIPIDPALRTLLVKADERAKDKTNGLTEAEVSNILDIVDARVGVAPMLRGELDEYYLDGGKVGGKP